MKEIREMKTRWGGGISELGPDIPYTSRIRLWLYGFLYIRHRQCPTDRYIISKPKNMPFDVSEQHKVQRSTDFEALKL